jgi:hypothetical protein
VPASALTCTEAQHHQNGNEATSQDTGTGDLNQFFYDERNRLSCAST